MRGGREREGHPIDIRYRSSCIAFSCGRADHVDLHIPYGFICGYRNYRLRPRRGRGDVIHRARENNNRSIPTTVRGMDEMRDTTSFLASRSHGIPTRITGEPIRCATDDGAGRVFGDDRRDLLGASSEASALHSTRTKSRSRACPPINVLVWPRIQF